MGDVQRASGLAVRLLTTLHREPALWSRAARGDATAFGVLYGRHHQDVYRYCRAMLHDEETARDAMRSAIARTFAALPAEERSVGLRSLLLRLAREETMARHGRESAAADPEASAAHPSAAGPVGGRRGAELCRDVARLPERQRTALVLRELNGLTDDEIAEVLGCSSSEAMKTVFDARSALDPRAGRRRALCAEAQRALSDGDGRAPRGRRLRAHVGLCRACADFKLAASRRSVEFAALAQPLPATAGTALLDQLLPAKPSSGLPVPADGAGGRHATTRSTRSDRRLIGARVMKAAAGVAALAMIAAGTLAFALTGNEDRAVSRPRPAVAEPRADAAVSRFPSAPAAAQRRTHPALVRNSPARERRARRSRASFNATAARAPGASAPRRAALTHEAAPRGVPVRVLDPPQQPTTQRRRPRQPTPERRTPTSTTEKPTPTSAPIPTQAPAPAPAPATPPQPAIPGPVTTERQAPEGPDVTPPTAAEPSDTAGDEPEEDGEKKEHKDKGNEPSD